MSSSSVPFRKRLGWMVSYAVALPFVYFIALLPFPLLYAFSDAICFLVRDVIGYRRKVVRENLAKSFPHLSEAEREQIARRFYAWFCDFLFETLKLLLMSPDTLRKRVEFPAAELFDKLAAEKKHLIITLGHYGNWEWGVSRTALHGSHPIVGLYRALHHPYFDRLLFRVRSRFGMIPVEVADTFRTVVQHQGSLTSYAFVADQTPHPDIAYWTPFLNQDTAIFTGAEKIAQRFDFTVVYCSIKRVKRGYYRYDLEILEANPTQTGKGDICEAFTRRLEQDIMAQPETWLWTHRRWKYTRPEKYYAGRPFTGPGQTA